MIFGLNLPNYSGLGHRDAVTAIAERADELGYACLWTSDHVLLPETLPTGLSVSIAAMRSASARPPRYADTDRG
jgi:alkanesulfonate monooxygenase SsuD/methylene tetrahydromethanopterin reductase-like flavin-dependent oxidoreductase (luciferase family)